MKRWPKWVWVGLLFLCSAWWMTFPLGLQWGSVINDVEDGLLNTWILAWDVEQILRGNIQHFFDANIFFPHKKVLAYSEHLFSLSLFAMPVILFSGNPLLAYNVVLFSTFVLCGFCLYLLAFRLTRNHSAAFIGGVIYAFAPYRFAQLTHIQVLWAWAIPLTFFYLHKWFDEKKDRYGAAMTVCFLIQILGNGYFALYLTLFLAIAFIFFFMAGQAL